MLDATSQVDSTRMVPAAATPPPKPAYMPPGMETPDSLTKYVPSGKPLKPWGEDGFTFRDLVDIVNPLQHIPIVSTIYRQLTGSDISPISRVIGDTLFTGPVGTLVAMANTAVEHETGRDIGDNVYAYLTQDDLGQPPAAKQAVAANEWKNPDLQPLSTAFVAPAKPDLGVLSAFDTASGPSKTAKVEPIAMQPRPADEIDDDPDQPPDAPAPAEAAAAPAQPATAGSESGAPTPPPAVFDSWRPRAQALVPTDIPPGAQRTMRNLYSAGPQIKPVPPPEPAISDSAAKQLETQTKSAEDQQNDWLAQKMMMALDKYAQAQKLGNQQSDDTSTSTSVTR